jgi:NAD(P)-dependent dehydrogenase (short-subunit alcohol dehydrogenase family)
MAGALDGRVAVITGAASGIGLATAQRFKTEGAQVVVVDRNADDGERVAKELEGVFVAADVSDPGAWRNVVETAERELGGVDVAYLNAGVTTQNADITTLTDDQYRRVVGANVDGVVFGARAVTPAIERRGGGAIVATASLAGLIAFAPDPIYTMTKHAVVGLVRSLAPHLQAKGITINAVCPGIVDTPLVGEARSRIEAAGFPMMPPEDIADAVLKLAAGTQTGVCMVCQPGRQEPFEFNDAPGPRVPGAEGRRPPGM